MSVSLVVFRIEYNDEVYKQPDFIYTAPHFESHLSQTKTSYAKVVSNPQSTQEELCKHRGRREFQKITIETHMAEDGFTHTGASETTFNDQEGGSPTLSDKLEEGAVKDTVMPSGKTSKSSVKEAHPVRGRKYALQCRADSTGGVDGTPKESPSKVSGAMARAASFDDQRHNFHEKLKSYDSNPGCSAVAMGGHDNQEAGQDASDDKACSSRPSSAKVRPKSHSPTSLVPSSVRFFSGNPSVEATEGIIHLYKDNQMTSLTEDVPRSQMICMLAVPCTMTSQDLLHFVAPVQPGIEHIRIVRDATPNQYMILIKFRNQKLADEFYKNFNNKPFNSIEPEICHLVYVARVEAIGASEGAGLPVAGLTELPVCPVCLERMDESVDGILTILCNHSFHGFCLAQWGDTSCPVCRYVQTPETVADNKCFGCSAQESLWICLICGHVGCGRYLEGHAYRHFQDTHHTYAMQLGNNRVWDYAGDNYVHRLVQSKTDGKLVQVDEGGNLLQEEKLDSITLEYTYLLTSQLESQRHYFEEKIERVEKEAFEQLEVNETRYKKALEEYNKMEQFLSAASKDKQMFEKKCTQMASRMTKVLHDLKEEREINKCLQQNQTQWQDKVGLLEKELQQKDAEMKELQEQLRDVMFYLEAQQKLSSTSMATQQEIQEGQIVVQQSAHSAGGATGFGKKSKKKSR